MKFLSKLNPTFSIYKVFPCGASDDTVATNETNERIARETNQANIAMNAENNATQIRLQQEMNDYNSLEQQIERAQRAGVNPNAVISGSVNGNLQTSLPQTQAGHADAYRMENPYAERLQTLALIQNAFDSFFRNMGMSAQTELTHFQAQGQYIENQHTDDLRNLQKILGRAQANKFNEEIQNLGQQRQLMLQQGDEIKASIANMTEDTRTKFLANQFSERSINGFHAYMRDYFDKQGIPRNKQLSDDALDGIYFGALSRYNIPMSEMQTQAVKRAYDRAGIGVQNSLRNFYNAQTQGQYINNAYDQMFGIAERSGNIAEQDARINNINANTRKIRQNYNIDNWQTSEQVQTQRALGVRLDNLQTEANIDNTKVNTAKQTAETAHEVVNTASDAINTFTPWAR